MLLILALSAVQLSDPTSGPQPTINPIDPEYWPTDSMRAGEHGNVRANVVVDPAGKAVRCEITSSTGYKRLDDLTCAAFMQRGRFKPARDAAGNAVHGVFALVMSWTNRFKGIPEKPPVIPSDVRVNVEGTSDRSPIIVRTALVASPDGAILHCVPIKPLTVQLGAVACREAAKLRYDKPVTDASGAAVVAIRTAVVEFVAPTPVAPSETKASN
jgi:TonB family protein